LSSDFAIDRQPRVVIVLKGFGDVTSEQSSEIAAMPSRHHCFAHERIRKLKDRCISRRSFGSQMSTFTGNIDQLPQFCFWCKRRCVSSEDFNRLAAKHRSGFIKPKAAMKTLGKEFEWLGQKSVTLGSFKRDHFPASALPTQCAGK